MASRDWADTVRPAVLAKEKLSITDEPLTHSLTNLVISRQMNSVFSGIYGLCESCESYGPTSYRDVQPG